MPLLDTLGHLSPCEIVDRYEDGRVRVLLTSVNAHLTVPGELVTAAPGEPALVHPKNPGRLGPLQVRVLEALFRAGPVGCTDDELVPTTGLLADSAGKRRLELARRGLVIDTGDTRTTTRGGTARVWQITTAGEDTIRRYHTEGVA